MYHEAANGLVRRVATDTGNDVNNPDYEPDGMTTITEEFIASMSFCNPFKSITHVFIQPDYQPETAATDLLLCRPCTKMQFIKFITKFINFSDDFTENVNEKFPLVKVSEYEVTLNNASPPDTDAGRRERVMNVDGEPYHLEEPNFHVKEDARCRDGVMNVDYEQYHLEEPNFHVK
ncbi:hypothetical protein MAR_037699 [Mya arenaria]|uniref:Uncharacterized protein n=1 Tax=Mya arenaria TaxID=6604 RepID=A0ABY7FPP6_MYAAR|nr:hypothetical protein MAR_037699 [Mya arenaria]